MVETPYHVDFAMPLSLPYTCFLPCSLRHVGSHHAPSSPPHSLFCSTLRCHTIRPSATLAERRMMFYASAI